MTARSGPLVQAWDLASGVPGVAQMPVGRFRGVVLVGR
ncbi:MAG: hypothetical protein QOE51_408 [Actinoplanes sp.]|nr:hypothetical protein [Actinoplanes sp.]